VHADEVLSRRRLGRALLARQLLLRREDLPPLAAIEHLLGMQAQAPQAPYVGLWSRLAGFDPEELSGLVTDRAAVRGQLMRVTVHLVSARDYVELRPLVAPVLERQLAASAHRKQHLAGVDLDELARTGRELLEKEPRSRAALRPLLAERFPGRDPESLAYAVSILTPVIQVPPRGLWRRGGQAALAPAEQWLGRPLDAAPAPDDVVLRYLRAYGPASPRDVQVWSGLTGVREVVERLRPRLATFRDEAGRELFDLPDAPRPDADTPAPPRFVPEYDNLLLSHADRGHVIADHHRPRIFTRGALLVDGYVTGTWKLARERGGAALQVELFGRLSRGARAEVLDEGAKLLEFAAPEADTRDVVFQTAAG
jgi:hypothetical protein